ncbi:hypothetical protein NDU88_003458 [Pleurodeles waltl]|uniref:Uncharacterized protein n=1 Tax=Pleurodeles waltl TaxID=8319 RepID=A0AAV7QFQ8_PLEWA|nr:hypothetical protein NDU88_003458 [Pleurodeles waltl]
MGEQRLCWSSSVVLLEPCGRCGCRWAWAQVPNQVPAPGGCDGGPPARQKVERRLALDGARRLEVCCESLDSGMLPSRWGAPSPVVLGQGAYVTFLAWRWLTVATGRLTCHDPGAGLVAWSRCGGGGLSPVHIVHPRGPSEG